MADIFWCNFGKYGVIGQNCLVPGSVTGSGGESYSPGNLAGEWTNFTAVANGTTGNGFTPSFAAARFGTGIAFTSAGGGNNLVNGFLNMTLPGGSRSRIIGGIGVTPNLITGSQFGILLCDGIGVPQIGISINPSGQVVVLSGGNSNQVPVTVLATSSVSVSAGTSHWLEWDITINNSTGAYTVDLDGTTVIGPVSSANTRGGSTNNSASVFSLFTSCTQSATPGIFGESLYLFDSTGGTNNAIFGNARVELLLPASDNSVNFTVQQGAIGYYWTGNTSTTNAPGANELALIPCTPAVNCTINSVGILPEATSAIANFKGVIYSDSSGAPHTLLSSGTQVTGCTSGSILTLTLTTPQSLTAGTQYWIGYITDTSVVLNLSYANSDPLKGQKASNTYTSGAPGTAPAMTTAQNTWQIWGNTSGQSHNYSEIISVPPPESLSYVYANVVNDEDQYNFQSLVATPTKIAGLKVSAVMQDSDAGVRTVNLEVISNSVSSGGSNTGFTPSTAWQFVSSYFDTDPNTSSAWTGAGIDSATAGPIIES